MLDTQAVFRWVGARLTWRQLRDRREQRAGSDPERGEGRV